MKLKLIKSITFYFKIMKKTSVFYAAGLMMACAFGVQSCSVEDNSVTSINWLTYDFEKAAAANENPGNVNGSAAKGQAFYGWEKSDKTDSKRQDYKGYEWAEGSVLPEECHVWRRSDRINGNIKEGGLYCPNDREMAIDGLDAFSAVRITYDAPMVTTKTSLKDVPFGSWSAWVNGELTNPFDPTWNEGVSDGLPYGDGSVIAYADLSGYAKLIVTVTEGSPRFLFNRDVDEGQWNENEAESHLIDNTKGGWSAKYFTSVDKGDGVTEWTVDLAQMVADKGYAHLHSIKGANWANCTATKMEVETAPALAQLVWAIGDGTSDGGPGAPRATALINGVEAVPGVTTIPSGALINITSVTPADNGTGYIVFKVTKKMVIKKIEISK